MATETELRHSARKMRREPTEPEKRLWRHLSNSQLGGLKFRRQAVLEPFIADFFCPAKGLIVEIDGETHGAGSDSRRDTLVQVRGFTTIRFTNQDVMFNMEGVLTVILEQLECLPDRAWGSPHCPTPTPPLKGRGF